MNRLRQIVTQAAKHIDHNYLVQSVIPVHGGDINENYIIEMTREEGDGVEVQKKLFLKVQHNSPEDFFEAEVEGLQALQRNLHIAFRDNPVALRTPKVLGKGILENSHYLILEHIPTESAVNSADYTLGRQLALFHSSENERTTSCRTAFFGFQNDNYIGSTPQINTHHANWIDFFRECRLGYQIDTAERHNLLDRKLRNQLDTLSGELENLLTEPKYPVLVHGDLWSGNIMKANSGEWILFDPAVYYGHPEVDIAMTELFGGFGRSFYEGYHAVIPRDSGYEERRDLYNLYHMLNHLNLFGRSYESSVKNIVRKYL